MFASQSQLNIFGHQWNNCQRMQWFQAVRNHSLNVPVCQNHFSNRPRNHKAQLGIRTMEEEKEQVHHAYTNCSRSQQENDDTQLSDLPVTSGIDSKSPTHSTGLKNATLERESLSCASLVFYSFLFIKLDVLNQVITYGMKYLNNNSYPVPQTGIVFSTEALKFLCYVILISWTRGFQGFQEVRLSLWYSIPSICYAINNNVFLYALNYSTPPVWNILSQLRLVFTALAYRLFFKRAITRVQWVGLALLLIAVVLTNYTGVQGLMSHSNNLLTLLNLAALGACVAVTGNFSTEVSCPLK